MPEKTIKYFRLNPFKSMLIFALQRYSGQAWDLDELKQRIKRDYA